MLRSLNLFGYAKNNKEHTMWKRDEQDSQLTNMIEARLSRRHFLTGTAAAGAGAFLALNPVANAVAASPTSSLLNFEAVPASTADTVVVPKAIKQLR